MQNRPPDCDGFCCRDCGLFGCAYPPDVPEPIPAQSEREARVMPEERKDAA